MKDHPESRMFLAGAEMDGRAWIEAPIRPHKFIGPGRALAAVSKAGRVLVTANGRPKATMIPTSEGTFASDLELLDRVDLARPIAAIRSDAVTKGMERTHFPWRESTPR